MNNAPSDASDPSGLEPWEGGEITVNLPPTTVGKGLRVVTTKATPVGFETTGGNLQKIGDSGGIILTYQTIAWDKARAASPEKIRINHEYTFMKGEKGITQTTWKEKMFIQNFYYKTESVIAAFKPAQKPDTSALEMMEQVTKMNLIAKAAYKGLKKVIEAELTIPASVDLTADESAWRPYYSILVWKKVAGSEKTQTFEDVNVMPKETKLNNDIGEIFFYEPKLSVKKFTSVADLKQQIKEMNEAYAKAKEKEPTGIEAKKYPEKLIPYAPQYIFKGLERGD